MPGPGEGVSMGCARRRRMVLGLMVVSLVLSAPPVSGPRRDPMSSSSSSTTWAGATSPASATPAVDDREHRPPGRRGHPLRAVLRQLADLLALAQSRSRPASTRSAGGSPPTSTTGQTTTSAAWPSGSIPERPDAAPDAPEGRLRHRPLRQVAHGRPARRRRGPADHRVRLRRIADQLRGSRAAGPAASWTPTTELPAKRYALGSDNLGRGPITWEERSQVTAAFVAAALDFIDQAEARGKPFYINLWPDDVHSPFFPPRPDGATAESTASTSACSTPWTSNSACSSTTSAPATRCATTP